MRFLSNLKFQFVCFALIAGAIFSVSSSDVFASSTDGTIDSTYKHAWTEAGGWLDFGTSQGNVHISDSALTGYGWSANFGWISLNCSNDSSCATVDYKISNDSAGNLSGYAWSETAGWINFNPSNGGVSVNSFGEFSGYAWSENTGWIVFNCATTDTCGTVDYKVKTDWRPRSARPACNNATDDDSDGATDYPSDTGCASLEDTDETNPDGGGGILGSVGGGSTAPESRSQTVYPDGRVVYLEENKKEPPVVQISVAPSAVDGTQTASVYQTIESAAKAVESILPSFLKPKPKTEPPQEAPPDEIASESLPVFSGNWRLLEDKSIGTFALAPLPKEIMALADKFPELGKTFNKIGITKMSDLQKLKNAKFVLPGLSKEVGISGGVGVPLSSLSLSQKELLPSEIIFAKAGDFIDYQISLAIKDDGKPEQKINTIAGKPLDLAIKADKPVNKITGYLTVKNIEREMGRRNVPASSLLGAPIAAALGVNHPSGEKIEIEQKLLLGEFEYQDEDKDGIYTAQIASPLVHGEYEIISIMEYKDISLGKKELRLIVVIDPEGYIYEKNGNKETRIPEARVSLFQKNSQNGNFELWPAKNYQQVNPQKTDKSGNYSFLVTEGVYKLAVSAEDYYDFAGKEFSVEEGRGVHENIALKPKSWWRSLFGLLFK